MTVVYVLTAIYCGIMPSSKPDIKSCESHPLAMYAEEANCYSEASRVAANNTSRKVIGMYSCRPAYTGNKFTLVDRQEQSQVRGMPCLDPNSKHPRCR